MDTSLDIDTFTEIVESADFYEEKACEFPDHDTQKIVHDDGPGVWLSTVRCPAGCGSCVQMVVCDKQKRVIETVKVPKKWMTCTRCGFAREKFSDGFTHVWVGP